MPNFDQKKEAYGPYLARRAFRIFPVYLVCLVISFFITDISILALESFQFEHPKTERRLEIFQNFKDTPFIHTFLHTLLLHGLIPNHYLTDTAYTLMGQAWSLTLEFQFYILAPLILYFITASKFKFVVTVLLLLIIESYARDIMGHKSFFFAYSHYFIVGMLSYTLYENYAENNRSHKLFLSLSILLFTFVFFLLGFNKGLLSTAGLIIWVLVFYCEYVADRFNSKISVPITAVIRSKVAMYLGKISYSMYCSHMIFLYVCAYVFSTEAIITKVDGLFFILSMLIVPFCMTLLFSAMTFRFIEKPFIKLGKRLFL